MADHPESASTSESSSSNSEALHRRFRTGIMLLTLLTTLNGHNYPTLSESKFRGAFEPDVQGRRKHSADTLMESSISVMTIRSTEVSAVISSSYLDDPDGSDSERLPVQPTYNMLTMVQNPSVTSLINDQDGGELADQDDVGSATEHKVEAVTEDELESVSVKEGDCVVDGEVIQNEPVLHKAVQNSRGLEPTLTGVAVVANPDYNTKFNGDGSENQVIVVSEGNSHWNTIELGWTSLLQISNESPVADHIATLTDYINRYGRAEEPQRLDIYHKFTRYLVISCYEKMWRRMTDWPSLGFLCILFQIKHAQVREAYSSYGSCFPSLQRKDRRLGAALIDLEQQNLLVEVMKHSRKSSTISNLLKAFHQLSKSQEHPNPYNEQTCCDFHQLLIAVLSGYRQAITDFATTMGTKVSRKEQSRKRGAKRLTEKKDEREQGAEQPTVTKEEKRSTNQPTVTKEAKRSTNQPTVTKEEKRSTNQPAVTKEEKRANNLQKAAQRVLNYGDLLWRIAYSSMLPRHLQILESDRLLSMPNDSLSEFYKGYFKTTHASQDIVDDELGRSASSSLALTFLRWIRLQASYWAAQEVASSHVVGMKDSFKGFQIKMLALPHNTRRREMNCWKETIKKLFPTDTSTERFPPLTPATDTSTERPQSSTSTPFDAEDVITLLCKRLKSSRHNPKTRKIVTRFAQCLEKNEAMTPQGVEHCEAILAAMGEFKCRAVNEQSEVHKVLKDSPPKTIAVSKLCCLVCWLLMIILRGDSENYKVRGYHTTVYPVELPNWLPEGILEKIVFEIEILLCNEITLMMREEAMIAQNSKASVEPSSRSHGRNPSIESTSLMSTHSAESGVFPAQNWMGEA